MCVIQLYVQIAKVPTTAALCRFIYAGAKEYGTVSFSASTVNERKAQVGFRILEDEKTLEVTVFDYAPVDFFMEIYDFFKDDPQALMWDAKIQYIFSLVEEE